MRFEGNPEVLRNLIRKKKFAASGDIRKYEYRHALFASSGVIAGVFAAGKGRPLERRNLTQLVTYMIGTSTGAAAGQYLPSGLIAANTDMYWNEAVSEEFISFKRFFHGGGPVENTSFICEALRRRQNLEAFHASPVEFHVGVTCALTGEGKFLNAKRKGLDPINFVKASLSIPGLCGGPVEIDGHPYYDGAGAMGMPTREIIEQFSPTDLLIFPNCPSEEKGGLLKKIITGASLMKESPGLQRTFLRRHKRFAEGVQYLREQKQCRWAIVWSDSSIGHFEKDPLKLKDAADRADKFMSDLLDEAESYVEREQNQLLAAE